ncbi:ABC transporter permease [Paraclostridium bifermentans]|uniref:ABC transporter permease n=1 Tax=Paraclostridium bifermentans TaxID=1490 RepID=A0ABY8R8Q5_PARBF|nr:ABC transporter permease [Paraclostridium bifermentans]
MGLLLFFETLIIGVAAIVIGIIAGVVFSKLMLGILIKLIGLNLNISFEVSFKGVLGTVVLFMSIFLVIAYQSNRIIYKFNLIELFKASSVSEKANKGSKLLAILSIVFLLSGYGIYSLALNGINLIIAALVTLFMVVIGTFLFFSSFMFFIVKRQQGNEAKYYKGLNMISTSQLLYRIKSNAKMLSIIAILSATTLTAVGVSISVYFMSSQIVNQRTPYSYTLKIDNEDYIKEFEKALSDSKNHSLVDKAIFTYITLNSPQKNEDSFAEEYKIISLSNLNQILKLRGDRAIGSIKDDEFINVKPKERGIYVESSMDNDNKEIKLKLKTDEIKLKLKSDLDKKLYNSYGLDKTVVVSDRTFENLKSDNEVKNYYTYNITNQKTVKNLITQF